MSSFFDPNELWDMFAGEADVALVARMKLDDVEQQVADLRDENPDSSFLSDRRVATLLWEYAKSQVQKL